MGRGLTAALALVILVGVAGVLYVMVAAAIKPGDKGGLAGLNHGVMAKLQVLPEPIPAAPVAFVGDGAKPVRLTDFKGAHQVAHRFSTTALPA